MIPKEKQKKANKVTAIGAVQMVGGGLLALTLGAINLFNYFVTLACSGAGGSAWLFLTGLVFGGLLIWRGITNYKLASRFRLVARLVGENLTASFINLERRLYWSRKKLLRELRRQMDHGFWPNAYIDMTTETFIVDYNPIIVNTETSGNATLDEQLVEANKQIYEIAAAARQIQDANLKAQVERLVDIAGQIYAQVAKEPDKSHLVRRMFNYFLPTTVGLLNKYIELQNQPVKTDNMTEALGKITEVMGTLEAVYKNQLDALYKGNVMDVEAEIEVLQSMAGL